MRPLTRRWTLEDDELLKDLAARGASLVRAAAALKRKKPTVRERAKKLGCPFPPLHATRKKLAKVIAGAALTSSVDKGRQLRHRPRWQGVAVLYRP
jgi:hypothetical protein